MNTKKRRNLVLVVSLLSAILSGVLSILRDVNVTFEELDNLS